MKVRNQYAIEAHFRKGGPMQDKYKKVASREHDDANIPICEWAVFDADENEYACKSTSGRVFSICKQCELFEGEL